MLTQMNYPLNFVFPNGSEFQAMNPTSAEQLVKMSACFTDPTSFASTVTPRTNPNMAAPVPHLEPITVKVFTDATDFGAEDYYDQIVNVVKTWATRSRSMGNRGNRIAVVPAINILPVNDGVILEICVLVGTDVWYNERRMTVGFPCNKQEWEENVQNIFEHMDFSDFEAEIVRIESETHGIIYSNDSNGCDGCNCNDEIEEDERKDISVSLINIVGDLTCSEMDSREELLSCLESAQERLAELIDSIRG